METHSTIFAMASGTPLVGIAYHVKPREFMRQLGVEEYCIDDKELTVERLIQTFDALASKKDEVGLQLFDRAKKFSTVTKEDMYAMLKD